MGQWRPWPLEHLARAIVGGVSPIVIRFRWGLGTILRHEAALYSAEQRLERATLGRWQEVDLSRNAQGPTP